MVKIGKELTQQNAEDAIKDLRLSGYSREQLIEALNQQFPEQNKATSISDELQSLSDLFTKSLGDVVPIIRTVLFKQMLNIFSSICFVFRIRLELSNY